MKQFLSCLVLLLICAILPAQDFGLASYYSDDFEGRTTAYGDTYDKDELTCAHKRHAYGTRLRVTRLDNKKSVVVKVIDKGPFIRGRIVDLSRRAASILGILDMEPVEVRIDVVSGGTAPPPVSEVVRDAPEVEEVPRSYDATPPVAVERPAPEQLAERTPEPTPAPRADTRTETPEKIRPAESTTPAREVTSETRSSNDRFAPVGKDFSPYGLYKITLEKPVGEVKYGVQVGSFSNYENVLQRVAELQAKWFDNIMVNIEPGTNGTSQYKVILGPFDDLKYAQRYQENLKSRYDVRGFVIDLAELQGD
ncbi:MAG: septal ring lytic transglycosylase RlpA family protein [Bacteroidota bacterium]